jgi:hypothetical protein
MTLAKVLLPMEGDIPQAAAPVSSPEVRQTDRQTYLHSGLSSHDIPLSPLYRISLPLSVSS